MNKIVFIGGGTGISSILKKYNLIRRNDIDLSAIITTFDSGGSTGLLRRDFNIIGVGDMRQVLTSLAGNKDIEKLFAYRFPEVDSIKSHSFGNLVFTALEEINRSSERAIEIMHKMLEVKEHVIPASYDKANLVLKLEDGNTLFGEDNADDAGEYANNRICDVSLSAPAKISPLGRDKIQTADLIAIGPGDLYTSLIPPILTDGFKDALGLFKGKIVFIMPLMNKIGTTNGFTMWNYLHKLETYLGRNVDYVLANNANIPDNILNQYVKEGEEVPINDLIKAKCHVIQDNLIDIEEVMVDKNDLVKRSVLRHDSIKVFEEIFAIL